MRWGPTLWGLLGVPLAVMVIGVAIVVGVAVDVQARAWYVGGQDQATNIGAPFTRREARREVDEAPMPATENCVCHQYGSWGRGWLSTEKLSGPNVG